MAVVKGNLVRWLADPSGTAGVVTAVTARNVTVRFGDDERTFAQTNGVLERLVFAPADQVQTEPDKELGVVKSVSHAQDRVIYQVEFPSGSKTVLEDKLRPALISDPIALLRQGRVDDTRSCNLRLAAARLVFAHQFENLTSLSNSRVDIKEHQVAVVHRVATSYPHRFILADEVGLGKTIEAGLIIKELKARGMANRVLILAPSGIVSQWQFELRTKFNEAFAHYNKESIAFLQSRSPTTNVWTLEDNIVTSTSYASWDENRRREIALAGWDLVIIDEAHHARRVREGIGRYRSTNLYRLAEMLADPEIGRSLGYLMLTATPMQLDPFELYSLIELLDPTLFADEGDFERHRGDLAGLNRAVDLLRRWDRLSEADRDLTQAQVQDWLPGLTTGLESAEGRADVREALLSKHRLSEVLIRNRKANVGGFMPRVATVWPVEMTPQEWQAYDAITEYVRTGYARSRATRNNALGFLMAVFQKLNSSSSFALRQSLLRRIEKLEAGLPVQDSAADVEEADLEERPSEDVLSDLLGIRSASQGSMDEIRELARIVQLLDDIQLDSKAGVLLSRLSELSSSDADVKVLVFTQSRDTQEYIRQRVPSPWTVHIFHGQLDPREKDAVVGRFRDQHGPQILISTEAGGEGRNFQFCHTLVNYDLPWNPMKIEQRIGRLDRIGQRQPIKIFNFAVKDTIEERVLTVLSQRINLFEETIGGLDPILGEVEGDLQRVFLLAKSAGEQALAELDQNLESRVREARRAERQMADLIMDTKSYRKDEVERLLGQRSTINSDTLRRFTLASLSELGAKIGQHLPIEGAYELRLHGDFQDEFPQLVKEGLVRRGTFEPSMAREHEDLEFFAFGHPIVDALVQRARSNDYRGRASYRLIRTNDRQAARGWLFTFVLEFEGVLSSKEVFPVFISDDGEPDSELADWLVDRASVLKREEWGTTEPPVRGKNFDEAVETATRLAIERLLIRQAELESTNLDRVAQEREKLERFYEYRAIAAEEKLASVRRTFERVNESSDSEVQRIVPVWRKNVETAANLVAGIKTERERRLAQLATRDVVTAQHEVLTASFVEIVPEQESA